MCPDVSSSAAFLTTVYQTLARKDVPVADKVSDLSHFFMSNSSSEQKIQAKSKDRKKIKYVISS